MKKLLPLSLLVICSIMLTGCPYESDVPIQTPSLPIQESLLGQWVSDGESYNVYFITGAGNTQYRIKQQASTGDISYYTAHLSELKGVSFLNVYSEEKKSWYLYRVNALSTEDGKVVLVPVSSKIDARFSSSAELRSYVEKNMNLRSFYDNSDQAEYVRLAFPGNGN